MPQGVYFDLLPTELAGELLLLIPTYELLKTWLDLLHFDKFYIVLSALSPFWKRRFRRDISSIVNPPVSFDRNDYLNIYATLERAPLLNVSPTSYVQERHYDKIFSDYLGPSIDFNSASYWDLRDAYKKLANDMFQPTYMG